MTEPTNLVKTQPDENATYTVKAAVHDGGGHTDVVRRNVYIKLSANTSFHIGITIKPDKDIPSGRVWSWISYKDDAGAENFANSSAISYVIPAGVWTRLEWTVTVPAGMTSNLSCLSFFKIADETKFQATNFVVYPLTGGRIVRARGTTALVSVNDGAKGETGKSGIDLSNGKILFTDPYFASGTNSVHIYNNFNNGSVTVERVAKSSDNPFPNTSYELKITNTGTSTPGCGGFRWANQSRANAVFIYRIIAKFPTGRRIYFESNATGSDTEREWLTSNAGTGKFTEYIYKLTCGSAGHFSTTGYFYLDGALGTVSSPVEWRVAYATCFDMTNESDANQARTIANGKNKVVFSATANPSGTSGYSAGDIWFNKSTGGIWQFNGSKWNLHQVGTTSIANGAITADKVAANAINAQKINVDVLSAISANLGNIIAGDINGVTITGSEIKTNWILIDSMSGQHARVRITKDNFYFDIYTPYTDETPTSNSAPTSSQKFYFGNKRKGEHDYLRGLWLEGETGYDHEMVYRVLLDPYDGAADSVMIHNGDGEVAFQSGGYIYGYGGGQPTKILNKNNFGEPINSIAIGSEKEHTISFGWTGSRLRPVIDGNQIYMPVIDTIFYDPSNGMGSGVSLTSAATDYDALDIFCKTDDGTQIYTKVCNPTVGTTFEVSVNHIAAGGGNMWIKTKQFKISSSTYITTASIGSSYFTGNVRISSNSIPATVSQSDNITIIKVVGWKY